MRPSGFDRHDVIVAVATPAGEGALGIVRLSGDGVLGLASSFLRPCALQPRAATLAAVHDGGRAVDQVVATFFQGPNSYTGEDCLELSAHGSPYLLSRILETAARAGARLAEPGEFTRRAYQNGRLDLAQAEAVALLIRSRTELSARAALGQLEGGLSRAVEELRRRITGTLATVEASLDHPDDDLPAFQPETVASELASVRRSLSRLAATHRLGRLAAEGARVSIIGRPNAGKSSLLNALLGRDRAIVASEPGTTRDTLEESADLGGVRTLLVDTAGLREEAQAEDVEREGMRRTRRALECSDLALVVVDRSKDFREEDRSLLEEAAAGGRRVLVALNKSDLPARVGLSDLSVRCVEVSALSGDGVDRLVQALRDGVSESSAPEGEPLVLSVRHRLALERTEEALGRAQAVIAEGELAAVHLREGLAELGAIVGETAPEEVLRELFSRFCIGK